MEVHCGLTARYTKADLSITAQSGQIAAADSNLSESIDADQWTMRKLTDFQGDGFPLDGSCVLLDTATAGSLANGKVGIRSDIGGTLQITVTSTQTIPAVTLGSDIRHRHGHCQRSQLSTGPHCSHSSQRQVRDVDHHFHGRYPPVGDRFYHAGHLYVLQQCKPNLLRGQSAGRPLHGTALFPHI